MVYPLSNFVVTVPPGVEPISVGEAKQHLRQDAPDDDTLISGLIIAAREQVERMTSRALITRTIEFYRDQFPGIPPWPNSPVIELPQPPLIAVTGLSFIDSAFANHNWTVSGNNLLDETGAVNAHWDNVNEPGRIMLAYSQVWPNRVLKTVNALKITYTAGYGPDPVNVPQAAKQAMLLLIGSWYTFRESLEAGAASMPIPHGVDMLLGPLKNWNFA